MNGADLKKENLVLIKKIKILSWLLLFAFVANLVLGAYLTKGFWLKKNLEDAEFINPPYAEEVKEILKPLSYSGIQMFGGKDVHLSFDFNNGMWVLHNVHKFDDQGQLILEEGRYGTCGELAAYTANKIKPLFGESYTINFVRAGQSGYFLSPKASHIVLKISSNIKAGEVYILDPSFKKYGAMSGFEDYLFFEEMPSLDFMENKLKDIGNAPNTLIPLLMKNDYLVGFALEKMDGQFDERHFILALTLTKKYNYAGRYLFAIRRKANGDTEIFENKKLAYEILSEKEYELLRKKITELFNEATEDVQQ